MKVIVLIKVYSTMAGHHDTIGGIIAGLTDINFKGSCGDEGRSGLSAAL